jgi:argininosuccinate synthase
MKQRKHPKYFAPYEPKKTEIKKVLLLYTGGIKSSIMIPWIKERYKVHLTALAIDFGQRMITAKEAAEKAKTLGADASIVVDATEQFANEYVTRAIKANATYQGKFHLITTLTRPLIAKIAIDTAQQLGIECVAYASNLRGNDQLRIESLLLTLNPDIRILAPIRTERMERSEQIKLLQKYNISTYRDVHHWYEDNIWGTMVAGTALDDVSLIPDFDSYTHVQKPRTEHETTIETISIRFEKGIPVALNGQRISPVEMLNQLYEIGYKHRIGFDHYFEDTILGLKTRDIAISPAATILIEAHRQLEKFMSSRRENYFKTYIDQEWAYLAYDGFWFEPLLSDLNAYIDHMNQKVTGDVIMQLYKGIVEVVALKPAKSAFSEKLPTYTDFSAFNPQAVAGYIELSSLSMRIQNQTHKNILVSIGRRDAKYALVHECHTLNALGYNIYATYKTHKFLKTHGIPSTVVYKVAQSNHKPNLVDLIPAGRFDYIVNIPTGKKPSKKEAMDIGFISEQSGRLKIPLMTTPEAFKEFLAQLPRE